MNVAANKLMEQIRYSLMKDYRKKLEKESLGVIKFFIRDSTLAKTGVEDLIDCNDAVQMIPASEKLGLRTKEDFELFFGLLAKGLQKARDLNYGYLRVSYDVNHGSSDPKKKINMRMTLETETHYDRKYFY
ncbi:hypothetical protein [Brevibacillus centrosporus]|uniref:hypothetical protein n=1 Tax=Brevibacillus centrosporus TaxID=54910 RepID=UPI003B01125C